MSRIGLDGSVLIQTVKHPANYTPLIYCSASLIAAGMLIVVFGLAIMLIDHIELGPPHYDPEYERYVGANLAHIVGKSQPPSWYDFFKDLTESN